MLPDGRYEDDVLEEMLPVLNKLRDISRFIVYKDSNYDSNNKKLKKLIHHVKHGDAEKVFKLGSIQDEPDD